MKFPEQFRWPRPPFKGFDSNPGDPFGWFVIPGRWLNGRALKAMATDGADTGWQHVSVTLFDGGDRCPSWTEMAIIKDLFWDDSETVVQFHPAKSEYVNDHPGCLHLWKQVGKEFELPPSILVGYSKKS